MVSIPLACKSAAKVIPCLVIRFDPCRSSQIRTLVSEVVLLKFTFFFFSVRNLNCFDFFLTKLIKKFQSSKIIEKYDYETLSIFNFLS